MMLQEAMREAQGKMVWVDHLVGVVKVEVVILGKGTPIKPVKVTAAVVRVAVVGEEEAAAVAAEGVALTRMVTVMAVGMTVS